VSEPYRHTQVGYVTIAMVSAVIALILFLLVFLAFSWLSVGVLVILVTCLVFFPTLTVTVNADALAISYGPGLIRKRFALEGIESCRTVKNPWYYGWGLRLTPRGWLFNVSGLQAVELRMHSGCHYRIGTDEPDRLEAALRRALGQPGT